MRIIGLTGKAGCGKDTLGAYLAQSYGYKRYAMASPIKLMLSTLGLDPIEYEDRKKKEETHPLFGVSYRKMAQTLGTEWGRSLQPDFWIRVSAAMMDKYRREGVEGVVITDIRFENEARFVRQFGQLWHITGRSIEIASDGKNHASEQGIKANHNTDKIILNCSSVEAMYRRAEAIIEGLNIK